MTPEDMARIDAARKIEDRGQGFCPLAEFRTPGGIAAVGGFPLPAGEPVSGLPVVRAVFAAACRSWGAEVPINDRSAA